MACTKPGCSCKKPSNSAKAVSEGHALVEKGDLQKAQAKFYSAIQLDNSNPFAKTAYLYTSHRLASYGPRYNTQMRLLASLIDSGESASPFSTFILMDDIDRQRKAAVKSASSIAAEVEGQEYTSWKPQSGKIKIGYMSSYFRKHALSVLIAEVLRLHDRDRFEIYIYSYGAADESTAERKKIMEYCDHFRNLKGINDFNAAKLIHEDGINILLDMNGYSGHIRPRILARRPAPVQGMWMSYPSTSGAPWMDFYISDKYIVGEAQRACFTERVYNMSRCCWTYDTVSRVADYSITRESAGIPKDAVVLGNFNGTHKLSKAILASWMTILREVPNAVLWTMVPKTAASTVFSNICKFAVRYGVDPSRIYPASMVDHKLHLGRFSQVDLVLDTFPCNGHTLSMDAMWAGCPLLTYAGNTPVSRVASSALRTMGMGSLVADSLTDYTNKGIQLASNPFFLTELRSQIESGKLSSPLFDQQSFVKELDSIYETIWLDFKKEKGLA